MSKADEAVTLFQHGFSCAGCAFGLCTAIWTRMGHSTSDNAGIWCGIAYTDDICGAVSGAIMVIGLRYGRITAEDKTAKEKTYAVVGEFLKQFKQRNGSEECTGLLGYNLSDPHQVAEVKKNKVVLARCPAFVRDAVELVEKLI